MRSDAIGGVIGCLALLAIAAIAIGGLLGLAVAVFNWIVL